MSKSPLDAEIARRATPQHGVLNRRQLSDIGLSGREIDYRVNVGRLHRLHRGVYAVGHIPPSPHSRAMAAVLACGPGAVLSHHSAAALWGLRRLPDVVHVTAPRDHRLRGVRVHRSRTLSKADTTVHYGIAVTGPARTVLDLVQELADRDLARMVNDARIARLVSLEALRALIERSPGRATARLKALIARDGGPTRSELEDAFLVFAERYELPLPGINEEIAGHEVDLLWPEQKLVAELDSRTVHDTKHAFEEDRDRDADLLVGGYRVIRITHERLTRRPAREAERLRRLLDR